jgi:transposase
MLYNAMLADRDVNAARNILKAGLEQARVEVEPLLVQRRRISKFGQ